jgi:hypothetical protein
LDEEYKGPFSTHIHTQLIKYACLGENWPAIISTEKKVFGKERKGSSQFNRKIAIDNQNVGDA